MPEGTEEHWRLVGPGQPHRPQVPEPAVPETFEDTVGMSGFGNVRGDLEFSARRAGLEILDSASRGLVMKEAMLRARGTTAQWDAFTEELTRRYGPSGGSR